MSTYRITFPVDIEAETEQEAIAKARRLTVFLDGVQIAEVSNVEFDRRDEPET